MTILKGGVFPNCESLPVEIEVAYYIVHELQKRNLLEVRKVSLGDRPYFVWELKTETVIKDGE